MKIEDRKKQSTLKRFLNGCEKFVSTSFYLTGLVINKSTYRTF
ncbi:MAG: hypothetical protein QGH95_02220 [Candidatus Nitrosopelagicus sp.]|nr:hypothetical protein [Candidatus Nitrosopelagicus sp.]